MLISKRNQNEQKEILSSPGSWGVEAPHSQRSPRESVQQQRQRGGGEGGGDPFSELQGKFSLKSPSKSKRKEKAKSKSSEEEEKDEATHSEKGKVHSEWEKGRREIVEACLL